MGAVIQLLGSSVTQCSSTAKLIYLTPVGFLFCRGVIKYEFYEGKGAYHSKSSF